MEICAVGRGGRILSARYLGLLFLQRSAVTRSSMVMAVTKVIVWLDILSDSAGMLSKIHTGRVRRQCMEFVRRSRLQSVTFIFVLGHSEIKGNERADSIASKAIVLDGRIMDRPR